MYLSIKTMNVILMLGFISTAHACDKPNTIWNTVSGRLQRTWDTYIKAPTIINTEKITDQQKESVDSPYKQFCQKQYA